ncbi:MULTISPECIES: hypothetical protein [unclassified Rathayibacter]|uniref:hypothetical protein n=1 Tax=unclassified Rathayibacter TaxID=2609250 RepID=UPI000CE91793|nr:MULTISPECIES: hypothetical protein [unclassified Rathayibacter]PPG07298.1 hypothetical protein C5C26_09820 [Rathayibacter sp. AY2B1]PPG73901.1 hypothetical protein C5C59_00025 [Rathayibacter sp. AY1F4]
MTSDNSPAEQGPLRRRTVVAGATWSLPVIAAATATPAAAASATQTLVFSSIPSNMIACTPSTAPITMTLSGGTVANVPVRVTLPPGFSFGGGATGIFVTDANGVATIPAGGVIAGPATGSALAFGGSAKTNAPFPVRQTGDLQYSTGLATVPDNSGFIHTSSQGVNGNVSVEANGDIWRYRQSDSWQKLGTGASTEPSTSGLTQGPDGTYDAHWIKDGVLQYGKEAATVPNNSGFVRTYGQGADGNVSITSTGDVWRYNSQSDAWTLLGTGASTEPSAAGISANSAGTLNVHWIKNGVLQYGTAAATVPTNSGFVRVYGLGTRGTIAVKSNGDIWRYTPQGNVWDRIGTGASTEPGAAGLTQGPGGTSEVHWIKDGVLQYGTQLATVPENSGFVRTYGQGADGNVSVKANGDIWHYDPAADTWRKIGSGASTGPDAAGITAQRIGTLNAHWIKARTDCR